MCCSVDVIFIALLYFILWLYRVCLDSIRLVWAALGAQLLEVDWWSSFGVSRVSCVRLLGFRFYMRKKLRKLQVLTFRKNPLSLFHPSAENILRPFVPNASCILHARGPDPGPEGAGWAQPRPSPSACAALAT